MGAMGECPRIRAVKNFTHPRYMYKVWVIDLNFIPQRMNK